MQRFRGPPGSGRVLPGSASKPAADGGGLLCGRRRPEIPTLAGSGDRLLREGIRLDPSYVRAYSNVGDALQDQGQLDKAIDYYEKALQLDPDYAWAHHNLANVLRVKHRLDEAYDHYQHAIRLDPKNSEVQNGVRSVLLRQGRGIEVQAAWRKVARRQSARA